MNAAEIMHPKEVVRFFIEAIKRSAAELDVETMPYDFERLARVASEVSSLAAWGHGPSMAGRPKEKTNG